MWHTLEKTKTAYAQWLHEDIADLIKLLNEKYQLGTLSQEDTKAFTRELQHFLQNTLIYVKITRIENNFIYCNPVQLTADGYILLEHPFLAQHWEFSTAIRHVESPEKFHVNDIVRVRYMANMNGPDSNDLLISLNLNSAKWVPLNLEQAFLKKGLIGKGFAISLEKKYDLPDSVEGLIADYILSKNTQFQHELKEQLKEQDDLLVEIEQRKKHVVEEKKALSEEEQFHYKTILKVKELLEEELDVEPLAATIPYERSTFFAHLQQLLYHNDEKSLIYEQKLLKAVFHSLQANIITILSGPSGTGKTSIIEGLSNCLDNVVTKVIPVQSSWTDTQDLLGYFHPTDKAFMPTPFMEALAEAALARNKDKVYIICLDEMNLAHIEYYFSEILSARESHNPTIQLYPEKHQKIAHYIFNDASSTAEQKINASELIHLYPAKFPIPQNVRFVGTLNMDHTVKPLSPKVIDRSFLVEINHLPTERKKVLRDALNEQPLQGKISYDYDQFVQAILQRDDYTSIIEDIEHICDVVSDFPNASLNSRGYKHLRQFLSFADDIEEAKQLIDMIILGKVLPRFEIKNKDLKDETLQQLNTHFNDYPYSLEKWQRMLKNNQTVHFW